MQGNTIVLAVAEKCDLSWKSYRFDQRQETLKFLVNASIETLPTQANLKRWKKSHSDKCPLCKGRQTTNHILNICSVWKDSGRWTWRHNNIISYIVNSIDLDKYIVHSDIPGHCTSNGGTFPPSICVTNLKPDIVIQEKATNSIHIFELTCPLESNIEIRNIENTNKYAHFVRNLSNFNCKLTCSEISSRGFINQRNLNNIHTIHTFTKKGVKLKTFKQNISVLSVLSSYHIWLCRSDPTFVEPPYLPAPYQDKVQDMNARNGGQ